MTQHEFRDLIDRVPALSDEQAGRLRRELDARQASPPEPESNDALTPDAQADQDAQHRLFKAGLLAEIKPSRRVATPTERLAPIVFEGDPLSETIIRERR